MSQQPSDAPPLPDSINVVFFSVSSEVDLDTSRIPRTMKISSTMTFKKFLSEGIRLQRDDDDLSSDIAVDNARIFVTASPRQPMSFRSSDLGSGWCKLSSTWGK
ncbi:hypothetical protein PM082_016967 [Marasmius tenuissimus]|nr:hypothetical protein PM082_016967 [Marasmius tenuissimus]